MRRYTPDQVEFVMALSAVAFFAAVYLPLAKVLTRDAASWVQIVFASLPLLALAAVVIVYWRRFR